VVTPEHTDISHSLLIWTCARRPDCAVVTPKHTDISHSLLVWTCARCPDCAVVTPKHTDISHSLLIWTPSLPTQIISFIRKQLFKIYVCLSTLTL
jgi:hypothetical protein